LRILFFENGSQ